MFFKTSDILTTGFLINIGHFCEPVDKNYRHEFWKWKRLHRLPKAWKYECAIVILTLQFLLPNQLQTLIVSLFHPRLKNGTIWSLITTKTLFYWANIDKKGFPSLTSAGNLTCCDNLAHAQKSGNAHFTCQQWRTLVLSTLFTAKVVDFIHFQSVSRWICRSNWPTIWWRMVDIF